MELHIELCYEYFFKMDNHDERSETPQRLFNLSPVFSATPASRPVTNLRYPTSSHPRFPSPMAGSSTSTNDYSQLMNRLDQLERENLALKERLNNNKAVSNTS